MVDVKDFWLALKFSWLRRALKTNSFWLSILEKDCSSILKYNVQISDILQMGPSKIKLLGGKLDNGFWKQVFCEVNHFMQGTIFCFPEKIALTPLWDNPMVSRNSKCLSTSSFPELLNRTYIFGDFFHSVTGDILKKAELEQKFDLVLMNETYLELKYILMNTLRQIGMVERCQILCPRPYQPLLISILNSVKKGCSLYYRCLRKCRNLGDNLTNREDKWHQELNCTLSAQIWNNIYTQCASLKYDNKLKWLQFQINRNSLYTNYRVNKFMPNVSPFCAFCTGNVPPFNLELISHLFFSCKIVQKFWEEIRFWLLSLQPPVELSIVRNKIIFGDLLSPMSSVQNHTILSAKFFIWKSKLQCANLCFHSFKIFFKGKLLELKGALSYIEKDEDFKKWQTIFDSL